MSSTCPGEYMSVKYWNGPQNRCNGSDFDEARKNESKTCVLQILGKELFFGVTAAPQTAQKARCMNLNPSCFPGNSLESIRDQRHSPRILKQDLIDHVKDPKIKSIAKPKWDSVPTKGGVPLPSLIATVDCFAFHGRALHGVL